jgi:transposase-like protein
LTVFDFPREQWKTLRTTNVIERLNEEFCRRVKTQGALPGEDAAFLLLYSLVAVLVHTKGFGRSFVTSM